MKITYLVNSYTVARFKFYREGNLYYEISYIAPNTQVCSFVFPIPISDTGTGTFEAQHKSITLMRWVRKHLETIEKGNDV